MPLHILHSSSLHPQELTSLLLNHTLSCTPTSDLILTTLTKAFDHLSRTHRSALRHCVVEKVRELVTGEGRVEERERGEGKVPTADTEARFVELSTLLRIGTSCQALLDVVAEEVLTLGKQKPL